MADPFLTRAVSAGIRPSGYAHKCHNEYMTLLQMCIWLLEELLQNSKHDLEGRKGVADSHLLLYISRNAIF